MSLATVKINRFEKCFQRGTLNQSSFKFLT
jgi:hypothetical protein